VRQAGTPPDPIEAWARPVTVPAAVVVTGAEPADEGAILLVQDATASAAVWATEPGALPLSAPEGPLLLELDDSCLTVESDGDLGSTQAADAQHWVIFQEFVVLPLPPASSTCSESRDHRGESNLCSRARISI